MKFIIMALFFLLGCHENFRLQTPALIISTASLESGRIHLYGNNLNSVQNIIATSANLSGYSMEIQSKTPTSLIIKLVHKSTSALSLAIGTVLSFSVATASAQTTVNLTISDTPSGAVSAFNLVACPSGWSNYTPAEGRFIAGIDPTDLGQTIGDINASELPAVASVLDLFTNTVGETGTPTATGGKLGKDGAGPALAPIYVTSEAPGISNTVTGTVKPPHVILKYCEKD